MDMEPYVDRLRHELLVAAETSGQQARELAERLATPLASVSRLTLLDALSAAAEEISHELAPGSVELRLRGGEPDFVVALPEGRGFGGAHVAGAEQDAALMMSLDTNDGAISRVSLRLPEQLKARVEQASGREGLSVNAWLVRAVAEAVGRVNHDPYVGRRAAAPRGQHYTGWVR